MQWNTCQTPWQNCHNASTVLTWLAKRSLHIEWYHAKQFYMVFVEHMAMITYIANELESFRIHLKTQLHKWRHFQANCYSQYASATFPNANNKIPQLSYTFTFPQCSHCRSLKRHKLKSVVNLVPLLTCITHSHLHSNMYTSHDAEILSAYYTVF